jgi:hypothetical protein
MSCLPACLLRPLYCVHLPLYRDCTVQGLTLAAKSVRPVSLVPPRTSVLQLAVLFIDDDSTVLPSFHLHYTTTPNLAFCGVYSNHQTLSLKSRPPAPHGAPTIHVPSH